MWLRTAEEEKPLDGRSYEEGKIQVFAHISSTASLKARLDGYIVLVAPRCSDPE